jgi:hypothetical protein
MERTLNPIAAELRSQALQLEDYEMLSRSMDATYTEWLNDAAAQIEYRQYLDEMNAVVPPYLERAA